MINFNLPEGYEWVDTSASQFNNALDKLINTKDDLLILGPGGTGKSLLLELTYQMLKVDYTVAVLAPTGIAASNLANKGVVASTLNSFFEVAPVDLYERVVEASVAKQNIIESVDIIIIDEVSMITPAMFDHMGWLLRTIRRKRLRFILFGDVLQLPPVVDLNKPAVRDYYHDYYNYGTNFFDSIFFRGMTYELKYIVLNKIYRQSDTSFQNILNRIRLGKTTFNDLSIINSRVVKPTDYIKSHPKMLYLASTNSRVADLNTVYTNMFKDKPSMTYRSVSTGTMDKGYEDEITIYLGQQVMCTANNKPNGYQNGTIGIVKELKPDYVYIEKINGDIACVTTNTWIDHELDYDFNTKKVKINRPGTYTFMACKPAFASTIHKAQGLTLDYAYLDLVNWTPVAGVYLALSRCRTLNGLGLMRPISLRDIKVDSKAVKFYEDVVSRAF